MDNQNSFPRSRLCFLTSCLAPKGVPINHFTRIEVRMNIHIRLIKIRIIMGNEDMGKARISDGSDRNMSEEGSDPKREEEGVLSQERIMAYL